MKQMKTFVRLLIGVVLAVVVTIFVVTNYSWVFAKKVHGKILNVKRVTDPSAIISSKVTAEQLHSYSVLIQANDGKLYTSSSEDRQWEVANAGYCVEALLYRYPPWDLKNAGSFFNARLVQLSVCEGETAPPTPPPAASGEPAPESTPAPPAPVQEPPAIVPARPSAPKAPGH